MTNTSMEGTTSIVFGGRGFIGSHLVDLLLERGGLVRSFDRPSALAEPLVRDDRDNLVTLAGDFTSTADVSDSLDGCDYCFHLISTTLPKLSNLDPVYDVESNLVSTIHLLDKAVKVGVKKVIFVSSGGTVYGIPRTLPIPESHPTEPTCSYGITKLAIEKYLDLYKTLHGLDYQILRLSNPFGERQRTASSQGAVAVFLGKALAGETIEIWGDGSVVRDYIHVSDVVQAISLSAIHPTPARALNIGSGKGMSLNDVLSVMESLLGSRIKRRYSDARSFDVPANVLDISLARKYLHWQPLVEFETGLKRMISAQQQRGLHARSSISSTFEATKGSAT